MPYIDRDKLIKELSTMYKEPTSTEDFMTVGYDKAIADVVVTAHRQPTADVPERNVGKWIPVTERLPEDGQNVLVTVEGWYEGNMFERDADLATYFSFGGYIDGFDTINDWIEYGEWKATAWMPLPEPYREEKEDG